MLSIFSLNNFFIYNVAIIDINSSHHKSAQLNVIKNVGSPNCLTIHKTSPRKLIQLECVPFTLALNWYASSFIKDDILLSVKLFDNISGGKVKHELQGTNYEFKSTSYEFKSASYEFKFTSYEFKSMSYEFKSTS